MISRAWSSTSTDPRRNTATSTLARRQTARRGKRFVRSEGEHHKNLDATLKGVIALLDRQALVNQLVARTDTRKHALVQSLVERQHSVELEKKLNSLHPADAAFVLESVRQEQRIAAWLLIRRERR